MKYIRSIEIFEAVIIPKEIKGSLINSFDSLLKYGEINGFDVVDYDNFFRSLPEDSKKTAPPRSAPFFALFHPVNKKPMFVLNDPNAPRFIPNFGDIVQMIIGHEMIHDEQVKRKGNVKYILPNPTNNKEYFSNKDEIMAFSWTIADQLAKRSNGVSSAMDKLKSEDFPRGPGRDIWSRIKGSQNTKIINRYRKYIYLYLEQMLGETKKENIHQKINKRST